MIHNLYQPETTILNISTLRCVSCVSSDGSLGVSLCVLLRVCFFLCLTAVTRNADTQLQQTGQPKLDQLGSDPEDHK